MRLILPFIFVFSLTASSFYSQDKNADALQFYTNGLEEYNGQNYEDAISLYTKAINVNPGFAEAYFQRGCAKHYSDNYEGAIEDFNTSISLQPNNELFYKQRASSKTMIKDYNGAISDCDQAISLRKDYDKAYALRGILKIEMGEKDGCNDLEKAGKYGYHNAPIFLKKYCVK